jgi:hypothetical protein
MKQLLILTGPQGSGNHIFARIFSMHPKVKGWESLKDNYWVKHDKEPLIDGWIYPELLKKEYFDSNDYFVTDISFPFNFDGIRYTPNFIEFANKVKSWGIDVKFAIIVRDEKINSYQQERNNRDTLSSAKEFFQETLLTSGFPVNFLSLETFYMYKLHYLRYLENLLDFPIDCDNPNILKFITESPNNKYIKQAESHKLDLEGTVRGYSLDELAELQTYPMQGFDSNGKID